MDSFLVSQALAAVAFTCGVISFQCKKRRDVLLWLSASALTNAFHFFVLGRSSAGTMYVVMGVRVFTAAFTTDRRLMYLFMALILAGFFFSYERPLDILALFGSLLPTYGNFQQSEPEGTADLHGLRGDLDGAQLPGRQPGRGAHGDHLPGQQCDRVLADLSIRA